MDKRRYKIGDLIKNEAGLTLKVTDISSHRDEKTGKTHSYYKTACKECSYIIEKTADSLEKLKICSRCEEKPGALKTDGEGNCIAICRMGQLEFIHRLITEEDMTQRDAAELFVEAVKAHTVEGDPFAEDLTIEMVRAQFRRDSGKLKDKPKTGESWVGPTQDSPINDEVLEKEKNPGVNTTQKNLQQEIEPAVEDERVTDKFQAAITTMEEAIQTEREAGWSQMTKKTALRYAEKILNNIRQKEKTS